MHGISVYHCLNHRYNYVSINFLWNQKISRLYILMLKYIFIPVPHNSPVNPASHRHALPSSLQVPPFIHVLAAEQSTAERRENILKLTNLYIHRSRGNAWMTSLQTLLSFINSEPFWKPSWNLHLKKLIHPLKLSLTLLVYIVGKQFSVTHTDTLSPKDNIIE